MENEITVSKPGKSGKSALSASRLALDAVCIALVFVSTRVLQIPIPLGFAHLGNAFILLAAVYFGPVTGAFAGGVGSALADLTSFPAWTLPTLIIKSVMGLICGLIAGKAQEGKPRVRQARVFVAVVVTIAEMVFGYFAAGSIIYGSVATGLTQVPGLAMEGVIGIVLFYLLGGALERTGVLKRVGR